LKIFNSDWSPISSSAALLSLDKWYSVQFSSVAQLCLTLQPHGLQHTSLPCSSPTSGACSNLCPLNQWCHPTISSSVILLGLIFFRIDWFDLLAVQGTLKSFLQHHSSVTCSNSHLLISFSPFNFVWNLSVLFFSSLWHYS